MTAQTRQVKGMKLKYEINFYTEKGKNMAKVKIYHNPRCSKSRQALEMLNDGGHDVEIIEYLKTGLDKVEVENLIVMLGDEVSSLIRKKETEFKENPFDTEKEKEIIKALTKTPKLLERPIVVKGKKAIIARPPEKIGDFV